MMKAISIALALFVAGSSAVTAQAQSSEWIENCGSAERGGFGASGCLVDEMGSLFQTLDGSYFDALDTGLNIADNRSMAAGFRVLGLALLLPEVHQGACSDEADGLLTVAREVVNSISRARNRSDAQKELLFSLKIVLEAGQKYVRRGCL